jgi:hypothetical protein
MNDEKSTPIESLNNRSDDSEVYNNILNKYNNLQDGQTSIPPLNPNLPQMENQFENRNLNQEMYNLSKNDVYAEQYQKEIQKTKQYIEPVEDQQYEDEDNEEYEEYEIVEVPLWKRIINELRIPFFIFIFILVLYNCSFDKFLVKNIPKLGNQFNECNTYGFLLKAFLVAILSYLLIKFVRF